MQRLWRRLQAFFYYCGDQIDKLVRLLRNYYTEGIIYISHYYLFVCAPLVCLFLGFAVLTPVLLASLIGVPLVFCPVLIPLVTIFWSRFVNIDMNALYDNHPILAGAFEKFRNLIGKFYGKNQFISFLNKFIFSLPVYTALLSALFFFTLHTAIIPAPVLLAVGLTYIFAAILLPSVLLIYSYFHAKHNYNSHRRRNRVVTQQQAQPPSEATPLLTSEGEAAQNNEALTQPAINPSKYCYLSPKEIFELPQKIKAEQLALATLKYHRCITDLSYKQDFYPSSIIPGIDTVIWTTVHGIFKLKPQVVWQGDQNTPSSNTENQPTHSEQTIDCTDIQTLPPELLMTIFTFLPVVNLPHAAAVCRSWHNMITYDAPLWRLTYENQFSSTEKEVVACINPESLQEKFLDAPEMCTRLQEDLPLHRVKSLVLLKLIYIAKLFSVDDKNYQEYREADWAANEDMKLRGSFVFLMLRQLGVEKPSRLHYFCERKLESMFNAGNSSRDSVSSNDNYQKETRAAEIRKLLREVFDSEKKTDNLYSLPISPVSS